MSTNTVPTTRREPRIVTIPVTIDCPDWCEADHTGASGIDDVWHTRVLASLDEDTDVILSLAEVTRVREGYWIPPEVNVNLRGNAVEFEVRAGQHTNALEIAEFRVLADLMTEAAARLRTWSAFPTRTDEVSRLEATS